MDAAEALLVALEAAAVRRVLEHSAACGDTSGPALDLGTGVVHPDLVCFSTRVLGQVARRVKPAEVPDALAEPA
jgi:hypothetical protein